MDIDLLRQQSRWKDGLMAIRQLMANLVQQVGQSRRLETRLYVGSNSYQNVPVDMSVHVCMHSILSKCA